ncbi:MAG: LpxI family protein [Lentisphaerae bacterium]|jgi:DUF1009 family protein|nr:LpxI family protein [Lentisphaerota bacterium]
MTYNTPPDSITIIAGWGLFPLLLARGARAAGVRHISMIGFKHSTYRATLKMADKARVVPFGNLEMLNIALKETGCKNTFLSGQINPLALFRTRTDEGFKREIGSIKIRHAHSLFLCFVEYLENMGANILPSSLFMGEHIPGAGILTKRKPDEREDDDMEYGNHIAQKIADLDIGQSAAIKDGVVLAVEGFDGTNGAIKHAGRIARRGAVLSKVAKENHDMRFDIPIAGTKTIKAMRSAGFSAMSVQAHRTIIVNMEETVRLADKYGISIRSIQSPYPPAPIFDKP